MFNIFHTLIPGGSDGKESAHNVGNLGSVPGSGRSPGEENGNPLQYSCLGNSMGRGAWWAMSLGTQLSKHTTVFHYVYIIFYLPIQLWTLKLCPYFKLIIFKKFTSIYI